MDKFLRRMSICFAAGCFGGLINALVLTYLGREGIPQAFGVAIAPSLTASFLYPRIVWGGLWGFLFMLPFWKGGFWTGVFSRGIIFSFLPTLFQLFCVFPFMQGKGMLGLSLGKLTPVFVCLLNVVWGLCTASWLYIQNANSR
ncbi:MAG: hypothetical protein AB2L11_04780 [Syntrophobacteraceae bacterium]